MLVQRILDFIKTLEKEGTPIPCDKMLSECLSERFSKKPSSAELTADDIHFLLSCYKSRWESIVDKEDDYTRNPSPSNLLWINLASELTPITGINYLKILIPTLVNEKDLNDFSSLNETVNLFNFYLGHGGKTLYRKWSFCKHLENWKFTLSTYRADKKLSVVTIDELARLKLCKETAREVSVDDEYFKNFWDLMRKKVFVNLRAQGRMPIALLPHLLELIERYYYLRSKNSDFSIFKNDIRNFFNRLYGYELADVNFLYGTKIEYKKDEQYLLDLFINLHTANDYSEIDYEIQTLGKCLFEINPDLKAKSKELAPVYQRVSVKIEPSEPQFVQTDAFVNCCKLLVSLLTTQFEFSFFFTRQTPSLWDKKNAVFPEAYGIFVILLPLIAANKPKALEAAYADIIKDIVIPARKDNSWCTWLTRFKSTNRWLELAQNCKLDELGVYWFEPELLFNALLLFNTNNQSIKTHINHFLDDIIQTYAQNQNDLMKQFRVNILFTEFLDELSESQRTNLLRLIKLCDPQIAKAKFLLNCTKHINAHVAKLSQRTEASSVHFFPQVSKLEVTRLFNLTEEIKDVETMMFEYKTQLSKFNILPVIGERISNYLLKISQPILSVAQKENAKDCEAPILDYIGQYN
ncbi:Uncharacterised protein [Legionella steigerwaltii]|uniref:Uncharacterized protein n=1 Tax=Legionella steigerwaltii TaxID=460 RepID=A0A378LBB4_9GAMM|nr:hypothetical protein [Legionella steigerwaltii]KTD78584.1 hypothetical protein Lstg_1053 [Legionella steigerwaltii]STY24325.1 Uncharacterised protein [Legionella steigerwaltii]